ncbi:DUF3888 domain-containing protein [Sporosarcina thermotolerans]|uniref:DUF3888 domain-containing protein n=1 Tax=Sporosarcina thermotolerans TaxID=633404 RepID=UPI0024BC45DB|nr:DUF3888 domain-containing protein [Sporosarcina thermotolerans]WHT48989.1 DUF3888 domain-containing protein [Sporosarcina thermotolerans]
MKKFYFLSFFLVLTTLLQPLVPKANEPFADLEDALLVTLQPFIAQGIIDYYGYDKPYKLHDAEVVVVKREKEGEFAFIVEVRVKTFETSENPPYGNETLKFGLNSKGALLLEFSMLATRKKRA